MTSLDNTINRATGAELEHILRVAARRLERLMEDGYSLYHERVAKRAYQLWHRAGSPRGRDLEFWFKAESEVTKELPAFVTH